MEKTVLQENPRRKTVGKTPNAIGLSQEGCSRLVPREALAHIGAKS